MNSSKDVAETLIALANKLGAGGFDWCPIIDTNGMGTDMRDFETL